MSICPKHDIERTRRNGSTGTECVLCRKEYEKDYRNKNKDKLKLKKKLRRNGEDVPDGRKRIAKFVGIDKTIKQEEQDALLGLIGNELSWVDFRDSASDFNGAIVLQIPDQKRYIVKDLKLVLME